MNKQVKTGQWIWLQEEATPDEHALFLTSFAAQEGKHYSLKISGDGIYAAYCNQRLAGFSQCSDFPFFKYYDIFDLDDLIQEGLNEIRISIWHLGGDFSCYHKGSPCLFFEIYENGTLLVASNESTLSALDNRYAQHIKKIFTLQMGYSFVFDARKNVNSFSESKLVQAPLVLSKRPTAPLKIETTTWGSEIDNGPNHKIFELPETAGFLNLETEADSNTSFKIIFGEHLANGRVTRIITSRDFSVDYQAKPGFNEFHEHLRRVAARYIEVQFDKEPKSIKVGLQPVMADIQWKKPLLKDPVDQKIVDACINTLRLCIHEHYEDCPWREQSLYALDARNQMLCGYDFSENTNAQRANLVLLSKGIHSTTGLLTICSPSSVDMCIPCFSLFYLLAIAEYIEHTKDQTLLSEVQQTVIQIFSVFESRIDENGLIPRFEEKGAWNFYEWTGGSSGSSDGKYDLLINLIYIYVCKRWEEATGEHHPYEKVLEAIEPTFYDRKNQVFRLNEKEDATASSLGNAFAILSGLGDINLARRLLVDKTMVNASLSMKCFIYDAMLKLNPSFKEEIIKDIRDVYLPMVEKGTTVWETENGWEDFGTAGSLCHGWSAIAAHYYLLFGMIK